MQPFKKVIVFITSIKTNSMQIKKLTFFLFLFCTISLLHAQEVENQEQEDYIEFNDRKNIVHGVYLGMHIHYGEINNKRTWFNSFKLAYVANRKFEVGVAIAGLYSKQDILNNTSLKVEDIVGGYAGIHLEPIFFSKSLINLSFPVLIGGGAIGFVEKNSEADFENDNWDNFFIVEPGINVLFNLSRYVQLEAGVRYRLSSKVKITPSVVNRLNGFSAGAGIKIGIFNMGRKRYKKNL